jgi:hypothetical protein
MTGYSEHFYPFVARMAMVRMLGLGTHLVFRSRIRRHLPMPRESRTADSFPAMLAMAHLPPLPYAIQSNTFECVVTVYNNNLARHERLAAGRYFQGMPEV